MEDDTGNAPRGTPQRATASVEQIFFGLDLDHDFPCATCSVSNLIDNLSYVSASVTIVDKCESIS